MTGLIARNRKKLLLLAAGWAAIAVPAVITAQATAPVFDSVSIKPHPSGELIPIIPSGAPFPVNSPGIMPDGIRDENTTLVALVENAYGLYWRFVDDVLIGEPDWAKTEKFDIEAKMSETDIAEMQTLSITEQYARRGRMLRALLADRFKLKVHWEKRVLPIYALVVAKNGAKLTPSLKTGSNIYQRVNPVVVQGGEGVTVTTFAAQLLARDVGRVVFDRTGIKGGYDIALTLTPYDTQFWRTGARIPPPSDDPNAPPSLYTTIQEQLGLKLEPAKAPLDVLVIDHVERPSPN